MQQLCNDCRPQHKRRADVLEDETCGGEAYASVSVVNIGPSAENPNGASATYKLGRGRSNIASTATSASDANLNGSTAAHGGGRGRSKRVANAHANATSAACGSGGDQSKRAVNAISSSAANTIATSAGDPFVGKLVAFYCPSEIGQLLIDSFGDSWTDDARCYLIRKDSDHIVGSIIQCTKPVRKKKRNIYML
jgi:hypothetical protein